MSSGRSWYLSPIAAIFTTTIISFFFFFFFNDTATTEIYTLSLHDALPISLLGRPIPTGLRGRAARPPRQRRGAVPVRGHGGRPPAPGGACLGRATRAPPGRPRPRARHVAPPGPRRPHPLLRRARPHRGPVPAPPA